MLEPVGDILKRVRIVYGAHNLHEKPVVHVPDPTEPTRVKQEFKDEVNINSIISRMKKGIPPRFSDATPFYGDFTNLPASFTDAFNIVARAQEAFDSLPLGFRRELDHDPRNLEGAPRELFEKYGLLKADSKASGQPVVDSSNHGAAHASSAGDRASNGHASASNQISVKNSASQSDQD